MNGLWITRQDPRPANSGELIYSLGLLRSLAATGARLTVLAHRAKSTPPSDESLGIDWRLVGEIPSGRLRGLASTLPSDAFRLGNPSQRQALRELIGQQRWDWFIIDQAACGWALPHLPAGSRIAYIAHNDESTVRREVAADRSGSLPLRLALRWDAAKYARLETAVARASSLITAITPRDRQAFQQRHPAIPAIVLPPGYEAPVPLTDPTPLDASTPRRVVLTGAFEWLAKRRNLETFLHAAHSVFPSRGIELLVVGKADPAWFASLAQRYPWTRFHANVPSIHPYLRDARIGLIPESLGGGFKLKALDYIFMGLPLAAITPALSGVPIDPLRDAVTGDSPVSLAQAIAGRIDDLDFLNAAAQRAFLACRDNFYWHSRGQSLRAALDRHSA